MKITQHREGNRLIIQAHDPDVIGAAFIYDGVMTSMWVDPDHRRKGVATAIWAHSSATLGHTRTREGQAWIDSLPI